MTFLKSSMIVTLVAASALAAGGCTSGQSDPKIPADQAIIDARDTLRQAAEESSARAHDQQEAARIAVVRANAIEALSQTVGAKEGGLYVQALGDEFPCVQFAAAMAIGDVRYMPAKPALMKMAAAEGPDKRTYAGVIYALHRLGDSGRMQDLPRLMGHREPEVRALTALVLGKLGEPSAIYMLQGRVNDDHEARVELQLVESMAMLGDPKAKTMLEGYTKQPVLDNCLVAIPALARVRSDHAFVVLTDLTSSKHPIPLRVAAAGALAQLGVTSDANYKLCMQAAADPVEMVRSFPWSRNDLSPSDVALIQRLAAISLGWMGRRGALDVLHDMLRNDDGTIRVAAAMSILRILTPFYSSKEPTAPAAEIPVAATATRVSSAPAAESSSERPPERVVPERPKLETVGPRQ